MTDVGNTDYGSPSDLRNEDWLKTRTWDVREGIELVTTIEQLRRVTDLSDARLRALPAIEAAPPEIRAALGLDPDAQPPGSPTTGFEPPAAV